MEDQVSAALSCPECGENIAPNARFCSHCGHKLTARVDWRSGQPRTYTPRHLSDKILASRAGLEGERKQVSVMFCDIVRSTALAAELGAERFHDLISDFFTL